MKKTVKSENVVATAEAANLVPRKQRGIKSRTRVRERGEVFTEKREVDNILNLTQATSNRYWRFLEPACGNGNFLEAILRQRLEHLKQDKLGWDKKNREFEVLKILSTIYGVDIAEDNIEECKKRLLDVVFEYLPGKAKQGFLLALQEILRTNLIVGDMLNGKEKIFFVEYSTPSKKCFKRRVYALTDMEAGVEKIIAEYPLVKYEAMEAIKIPDRNEGPCTEPKQLELFGEDYE